MNVLVPAVCSSFAVVERAAAPCSWQQHSAHLAGCQTSQDQTQTSADPPSPGAGWHAPATGHCPLADANIKDRKWRTQEVSSFQCFIQVTSLNAPHCRSMQSAVTNISANLKISAIYNQIHTAIQRYIFMKFNFIKYLNAGFIHNCIRTAQWCNSYMSFLIFLLTECNLWAFSFSLLSTLEFPLISLFYVTV